MSEQAVRRYQELALLGEGGMGSAWKVLDRLTGDVVTLKRPRRDANVDLDALTPVRLPDESEEELALDDTVGSDRGAVGETLDSGSASGRIAIAREFRVLAGLRHPNIISVLDYGFSADLSPYFTMELVEDADHIVDATRGRSAAERVRLLLQTLDALLYLHRRGVIHRDIKPSNVLVSAGAVKVLDFGIATPTADTSDYQIAGTMGYIAPEVMLGQPPTPRSDLYSFGVLASWVLFDKPPGLLTADHDARLRAVVERLVKLKPEERYADATDVIRALSEAAGLTQPAESDAAREGFLTAATFVGRKDELKLLFTRYVDAAAGYGGCVLVGGESGVGKTRLIAELRIRALVAGALVVRGQAKSHGARPYQLWRRVAGTLAVETEPTPRELGILRPLVPDLQRLFDDVGDIPEPPDQDPDASRARMIGALIDVMRRVDRPILVILEDIHWARQESIETLAALRRELSGMNVMVVCTFRDDELVATEALADFEVLTLSRLPPDEIADMSAAILGESGRDERVVTLLEKETEGNPFFLVEVLRAYAEHAGRLDRITADDLEHKVLPRGIGELIARRLDRLGPDARPRFRLAAVCGRTLNPDVLAALDPHFDWEEAMHMASYAAVVAAEDGQWRFAHDKLREQLASRGPGRLGGRKRTRGAGARGGLWR